MQLRQQKYLNNIVEQDHRFIKKRVHSMLGFKSFKTATFIEWGGSHAYDRKGTDRFTESVCPKSERV